MHSLRSLLLKDQNHFSHQKILSLYLDSIDFLYYRNNSTIEGKAQISQLLIRKFKIEESFCEKSDNKIERIMRPILQCLFYLLNYCFQPPFDSWKQRNLTRIIGTLSILGWGIPKSLLLDMRHYFISQMPTKDYALILLRYMQYILVEQIQRNRNFRINNTKCIKEMQQKLQSCLSSIKHDQSGLNNLQGYYKVQRKARNIQDQNKGKISIFNLFISILQIEENHGKVTNTDHIQLLNQINNLKPSDFQNQSLFKIVKLFLWAWAAIRIRQTTILKSCGIDVLQMMISYTNDNSKFKSINIFSIILIQKLALNNKISVLKEMLQKFDSTINCHTIAQQFFCPQRLILAVNRNDEATFTKIITKISLMKAFEFYDFAFFENIATCYLKFMDSCFYLGKRQTFGKLVLQKLEPKIHDFVIFINQNTQMLRSDEMRQRFSLLIIRITSLVNWKNDQNQEIIEMSTFYRNRYAYLAMVESLATQYPSKEILRNFIILKVKVLFVDREVLKLVDFMENQKWYNLASFDHHRSIDEEYLLVAYYVSKAKKAQFLGQEPLQYQLKLAQIYKNLPFSPSCDFIFKQVQVIDQIVAIKKNPETVVSIFKTATQHVTNHPSRFNYKLLVYYLTRLHSNYEQTIFREVYNTKTASIHIQEVPNDQSYEELDQHVRLIFERMRKSCNFSLPRQNVYLPMLVYLNASLIYKNSLELASLQSLIPKVIDFLEFQARQLTLASFYYMELLGRRYKSRKRLIIERKFYKSWANIDEVQKSSLVFDFPTPCKFSLNNVDLLHKAGQIIRDKMYGYFENMQVKNLLLIKSKNTKRQPMQSCETGNIPLNHEGRLYMDTNKNSRHHTQKIY